MRGEVIIGIGSLLSYFCGSTAPDFQPCRADKYIVSAAWNLYGSGACIGLRCASNGLFILKPVLPGCP
ncbi:hypothetical protein MPER_10132 [Moniliophthora perniciosa FA553]|nr:hypothetical protein MPER_10132 [Moniliophthora perniciosa FA553]